MALVQDIHLVLSSDSATSTGNAHTFTQTLAEEVSLNPANNYEVCLVDAECPTPDPYTNKQLFITADICTMTDVNGVYQRFLGKSIQPLPTLLESQKVFITQPTQVFAKLFKTKFSEVAITIKDASGLSIPAVGSSSVTLSIRQI
jgi:hypothetical protein